MYEKNVCAVNPEMSTAGDSFEVPRLPKFKSREVNTVISYVDSVVQGYQQITTIKI